jgi:large subunit ribosomal protein L9
MQVILLEDVPDVGKKFEEHEVADGYGNNYLLPNGLARVANERTRAKYQKKKEEIEAKRKKQREQKAEAIAELEGAGITITTKTGEQGQLFAGVYAEDIAEAINQQVDLDVAIESEDVDRDQPLQKVGEYEVDITVLDETATVSVSVEGE